MLCSIHGLAPVKVAWNLEAAGYFLHQCENHNIFATFHRSDADGLQQDSFDNSHFNVTLFKQTSSGEMCDIGWKMIQKGMARAINDVEHFSQPQNGSDEQERAHPLSSDNPALVEAGKSTLDKRTASVFNGRKPSKTSDIKHLYILLDTLFRNL